MTASDLAFAVLPLDGGAERVLVGCAHNFVEIRAFAAADAGVPEAAWLSTERCLLYHMALWSPQLAALGREPLAAVHAASGTVFSSILLWTFVPALPAPQQQQQAAASAVPAHGPRIPRRLPDGPLVAPYATLRAHRGVIFRAVWRADGRALLSTSDDRTLCYWHAVEPSPGLLTSADSEGTPSSAPGVVSAAWKLRWQRFAHAARVWDACFVSPEAPDARPAVVATAGEDGLR